MKGWCCIASPTFVKEQRHAIHTSFTKDIHVVLLWLGGRHLSPIRTAHKENALILSGADVQQYIRFGGLKFEPELAPEQFQQNGIDMRIEAVQCELLSVGEFTLGVTREVVTMPNDLMAFVQLRSTWARKGFMLPPTVIDAGFHGSVTLEIARFQAAQQSLSERTAATTRIPVGERFAHIIFAKLSTPSEPYNGKYQNQSGITHAK